MSNSQNEPLRAQREDLVRGHIAAENAGDLDAMIATLHEPRYHVVPMGAVSDGEVAVRELVAGLLRGFPDFHFEPQVVHPRRQCRDHRSAHDRNPPRRMGGVEAAWEAHGPSRRLRVRLRRLPTHQ